MFFFTLLHNNNLRLNTKKAYPRRNPTKIQNLTNHTHFLGLITHPSWIIIGGISLK